MLLSQWKAEARAWFVRFSKLTLLSNSRRLAEISLGRCLSARALYEVLIV
jgi:hypothetical protein